MKIKSCWTEPNSPELQHEIECIEAKISNNEYPVADLPWWQGRLNFLKALQETYRE